MIVVVEGASAVGKTTWCQTHAAEATVGELSPTPPPPGGPEEIAHFWTQRQSARWAKALRLEAQHGRAYCDSDPFKLHYTWSLWRLGMVGAEQWSAAYVAHREALARGDLGFADFVVLLEAEDTELRRRREADPARRRRNFELHLELAPFLSQWYSALDGIEPGRVLRHRKVVSEPAIPPRTCRSDPTLLEALVEYLPEPRRPTSRCS